MKKFFYENIEELQQILENVAICSNGGQCGTYNYCMYCKEPHKIVRRSDFPCAEAFKNGRLKIVHTICDGKKAKADSDKKNDYTIYVLQKKAKLKADEIAKRNQRRAFVDAIIK